MMKNDDVHTIHCNLNVVSPNTLDTKIIARMARPDMDMSHKK